MNNFNGNCKTLIFGASYPDVIKIFCSLKSEACLVGDVGFIDDSLYPAVQEFMGLPILGASDLLVSVPRSVRVINNVHSTTKSRYKVAAIINNLGFTPFSLVYSEIDTSFVSIGEGVFVHQCHMGANVVIGNHVSIKIGSIINHDNKLENYSFVGPGVTLCGHVTVGRGAYVGAGAVVKEHVKIGEGAVIGAGAIVLKDVEPWSVVVGSPAKKIREVEYFDFGD